MGTISYLAKMAADREKRAAFKKLASSWVQLLRAGKLTSKSLQRIVQAAGGVPSKRMKPLSDAVFRQASAYAPRMKRPLGRFGRPAPSKYFPSAPEYAGHYLKQHPRTMGRYADKFPFPGGYKNPAAQALENAFGQGGGWAEMATKPHWFKPGAMKSMSHDILKPWNQLSKQHQVPDHYISAIRKGLT